ncbi:MAG: CorA family divalent cation transporter, partial [bacterium]
MTQTQREEAFKEFNDDHLFADPAQLNGSLGKCLWIDIPKPTDSDWERLAQHFQFHPLALEDARTESQRAKVDGYEG